MIQYLTSGKTVLTVLGVFLLLAIGGYFFYFHRQLKGKSLLVRLTTAWGIATNGVVKWLCIATCFVGLVFWALVILGFITGKNESPREMAKATDVAKKPATAHRLAGPIGSEGGAAPSCSVTNTTVVPVEVKATNVTVVAEKVSVTNAVVADEPKPRTKKRRTPKTAVALTGTAIGSTPGAEAKGGIVVNVNNQPHIGINVGDGQVTLSSNTNRLTTLRADAGGYIGQPAQSAPSPTPVVRPAISAPRPMSPAIVWGTPQQAQVPQGPSGYLETMRYTEWLADRQARITDGRLDPRDPYAR